METIKLSKGKVALVDDEDYQRVSQFKWCANGTGTLFYAMRKDNQNKSILMHRFILGVTDKNIHVDHINHDTLDNRKVNMRLVSRTENNRNKSPHTNSTSKFLGVSWDKSRNKWRANIYVDKKLLHLGRFIYEAEAAKAYDNAAKTHYKEYANLNFK